ncbi:MAG: GTPase Der [Chlamydiales bacterium]|nr:GTPase Der [Chlamydiales bacterium]
MFKLAIVGRPNVGKSALFNRICKKRIAIVDEEEGITRDRLYAEAECFGFPFEVIDTGGVDPRSPDLFGEEIRRQTKIAIQEADTLVMVVDSTVGPTSLDKELAQVLLKTEKPITLAVNKIDEPNMLDRIHAFYGLGITNIVGISAIQSFQIAELLETSWHGFKPKPLEEKSSAVNVSIIGRANVGKSTLINALLNEKRCVVSPIAGTTRDTVDIPLTFQNRPYTLIDTAGIRRKKSEHAVVEKFAAIRTQRAIERSDVCVLMLDAKEGLTSQEKRIAKSIEKAGKGCVLVLNKWDLVEGFRMEHCLKALREESHFLGHCPVLFISAKEERNLNKIFDEVDLVHRASQTRIATHQLNKFMEKALQLNHPPMLTGKRLRVYYMTQVSVQPPRFVLFVNKPELMAETYKKYLINSFRRQFPFKGSPLEMLLRGKEEARAH